MADPNAPAPETAPDTPLAPEAPAAAADDLQARLAAAEAEVARLGEEFLRAKAETENTRRRAAEDVAKAHKYAVESFAASLLAVRDSLEAALAVGAPTVESFREGVEVTHRQLTAALEKAGVTEVDPGGQKFDPHRHEAMGQVDGGEEPNTVATVLRKGYLLNDRVIRPALVMVSRGPADRGAGGTPGA
ncbi:MAG TPA: nucleotide exchange factor GrpE [Usitatibacteraceae bacterium]|nr:nucleotide exchange factor GrpE [Usitatibacteraceae bacterium]HQY45383.1 nucleotide exchange factor GrpE [Usitatibacteraceae bacterium]HRA22742.1 nucleotide exchange factor GrpE [Usitatibacteraceae bacterium]